MVMHRLREHGDADYIEPVVPPLERLFAVATRAEDL